VEVITLPIKAHKIIEMLKLVMMASTFCWNVIYIAREEACYGLSEDRQVKDITYVFL
jgi:hypothetical protein